VLAQPQILEISETIEKGGFITALNLMAVLQAAHKRGTDVRSSLPSLRANLKHSDRCLRCATATTLIALDKESTETMVRFIFALATAPMQPGDHYQGIALNELEALGPVAKCVAPDLKLLFKESSPGQRIRIVGILRRVDPADTEVFKVVLKEFESDRPLIRRYAVEQTLDLRPLPPKEKERFLAAVEKAMKDPDEDVREAAKQVLEKLQEPQPAK
jgi:hypothetical protein